MTLIDFLVANPAVLAAVCTLIGGVVLKVLEKTLGRHAEQRTDRQDYRSEIKELNERVDKCEEEIRLWRNRYYAEQEEVALLRTVLINNNITPPVRANT